MWINGGNVNEKDRFNFLSTFMFVSLSSMSVHAENSPTPTATPTIAVTATPKVTIVPTVTPSVVVTSTPTATIKVTPTTTITSTPTTTVKATATSKVDSKDDKAGITPDSPIYGLERMIESVQVNLTFSDEGKAELLLSFANERLAEAQIMTEKKNYKLMEKVMKAYIKTVDQANKKAEAATEKDKDLEYVFNGIEITKQTADKIIIKVSGVIPKESEASLKEAVEKIAKRSIVESTFATAKSNLKEADKEQKVAERELKAAQKSGDKTAVAAAEEKLKAAVENKKEMEEIKDELKEYKKEIMDELNMGKCKDKDKKDKLPKIDEKIVMMQQCNKKHGNKHEKIMGNIEAAEK